MKGRDGHRSLLRVIRERSVVDGDDGPDIALGHPCDRESWSRRGWTGGYRPRHPQNRANLHISESPRGVDLAGPECPECVEFTCGSQSDRLLHRRVLFVGGSPLWGKGGLNGPVPIEIVLRSNPDETNSALDAPNPDPAPLTAHRRDLVFRERWMPVSVGNLSKECADGRGVVGRGAHAARAVGGHRRA